MSFEQTYFQFKHIIFVLLKKYRIEYNREEYTQLLTIKMWELTQKYSPHHSTTLQQFLFFRLNFYLIDLFRSQKQTEITIHSQYLIEQQINVIDHSNYQLMYEQFLQLLTTNEKKWLRLKLLGYKQFEIASMLNCSISTIKNYRKKVQVKYIKYYGLNQK
ncbi:MULTISPECIES: sigma-70 RNA polymerase sigma factor region 4 domain-containing protein [Staphylococcus]|uniref:Sigma-70 family RNA polymerase sigma factor n=4 Tax=Staphylococcus cohnii TaxID=29382 RepID=A0A2T4LP95_9STAP|nr:MULTISPECIES: LuxR C-terminal-related transcriptional regulator [Staphylococcus]MCE5034474.1 sigma-70 family RNA polymerase sigma factor [Staphylococcus cohnii]MSU28640.1 sigma-70 family RNA polymerase sigma factor [Staphylococcus sp. McC-251-APC-3A2]PTE99570.1 sigma-70 family RNA polymerase sigma factor [Staphylococcus cohnii]PTF17834.1 sigma-70 family RNA polymerase sigma factor [Staphylococcus cohnii]PTF32999.1 sigma-70 family RNA polymerase sigma factor [Staphylococcus cohnii]